MNIDLLKETVSLVLMQTPYKPFLCLPMSAMLYAIMNDNHGANAKLVTGNLLYGREYIFKQDFSISKARNAVFQEWREHAWVEIDDLICDLSFFRTLYSDAFTKPCKGELIKMFGEGRGTLIAHSLQVPSLIYEPVEYLSYDSATGIVRG